MNFELQENIIEFTMDMDWAPDEVIEYSLDILRRNNIKATLFMTNEVNIDLSGFELAIHPNFTSNNFEHHFRECLSKYPNSLGIRSHSLFYSERFRPLYKKYRFLYSSNAMQYRQENISMYKISPTVYEIPLFWMDCF